jgi:hypothetical protein
MAGPGGRLAGIASAFINGVPVTAKGACEYQPVGTKREAIYGMDGLAVGFSETVPKNDDATYTTRWTAMFGGTVVETPSAG